MKRSEKFQFILQSILRCLNQITATTLRGFCFSRIIFLAIDVGCAYREEHTMVSREPVASILARLASVIAPYPSGAISGAHRDALNKRSDAILKCANEWGKAMKLDESEFSRRQIPKALFDVLDDFDEAAAIVAAETYLSRLGWRIERPRPVCDVGK